MANPINKLSPRIVFLGTPRFAEIILRQLALTKFRPTLVITEPARPSGRKQILTQPVVRVAADELQIPVEQPLSRQALVDALSSERADLAIVAAYGRIFTQEMLATAQQGFLNIHPSLLPKYRGATPIQAALLAGDSETGVTIIRLDTGLDTGPIIVSKEVTIQPDESFPKLNERLAYISAEILVRSLPAYLAGRLRPQPQPTQNIIVTKTLSKTAGRLFGTEKPDQILRMLRAYTPWPGVWFELGGQRILLLEAAQQGNQILPTRLQLAGKQPVDWTTFQRDRSELARAVRDFLNTANSD